MLGIADHSPAILTVLLDRTKYRMTLLDDPDNWGDKLQEFAAVKNGKLIKVVFVAGVGLLNAIKNAKIALSDCKVVVFDEIDRLLSIDDIELHDATFDEDDEVWEFSKVSNDGLNTALASSCSGYDQEVDAEESDPQELEAEYSGVEDAMGGEKVAAGERHSSLLPIFGAQPEEEEVTTQVVAEPESIPESVSEAAEAPVEEKPKRKRGRPPKAKVEGAAEEKPKRKRGRPPKVRNEVEEILTKRRPPQKEEEESQGITQKRRSKIDPSTEDQAASEETPTAQAPTAYKIIEKSLSGRVEALVSKLQGSERKEYLDALMLWVVGVMTDDRYTKVRNHFLSKLDKRRVKGTEGFITGDYGNKMFDAFYDVTVFNTSIAEAAQHHKVVADDLFYVVDRCPDLGDKPKFQWKPDPEFIKMRKKQLRAKS
jgi:hypothetical protein